MDSTAKDKHSPYVTIPNATFYVPKYTWQCDVFGNRLIVVDVMESQSPTAWQRFWSKFFLGTKWERITWLQKNTRKTAAQVIEQGE